MIQRNISAYILNIFDKYPIVTILGPRQSGKTYLVKELFPDKPYINLESPEEREKIKADVNGFLNRYSDGAILDEIQRFPELLSYLQVYVDEKRKNSLFVLTGSQQLELLKGISQTLAGRTALLRLLPLSISEIKENFPSITLNDILFSGCYPRIYDQQIPALQYYGDYVDTYLEKDLRQLIAIKDLSLFIKFIKLCAGRVGQILNLNSLANDVGVNSATIKNWISVLEAGYIIFLLPPFFSNISKRLIKSPKLYFYDVGLASYLLDIENKEQIESHYLRGGLFENLVITEILKYRFNQGLRNNLCFYRDSNGNEVDLIYTKSNKKIPIEIKSASTFSSSFLKGIKNFTSTNQDASSQSLIIYNGETSEAGKASLLNPLNLNWKEVLENKEW